MLTMANYKEIANVNVEISTLMTEKEIAIGKLKSSIIDLEELVRILNSNCAV